MLKEKLKSYDIILASASPRRKDLLARLDLDFTTQVRPVKETYPHNLKRAEITDYLSQLKAEAFDHLDEKAILITSDTIVWHAGEALGKPQNKAAAVDLLKRISNDKHEVITSVCFTDKHSQTTIHDVTEVTMKALSDEEIDYYVDQYSPMDKAGAYGIQEWIGYIGVEKIHGCFYNVMGFPLRKVYEILYHWGDMQ